tara:strand:- start:135 stop:794 length:660 start_codon:yes stop_codon:yes gene_type:complete
MNPTITILICVHSNTVEGDGYLVEALESIHNQTYKSFEVILVLDACWEHTKPMIHNTGLLENMKVVERPKKEGLSFAKNTGLSYVTTEYVCFLDADDLYEPTKIERQIEFIRDNPDVDFLGTHALNISKSDRKTKTNSCFNETHFVTHEDISSVIEIANVLTHGSMMIKMKSLKELGMYNNVKGQEDWDLWKRAIQRGYTFHQLSERLYVWCSGTSVPR